jgi:hypothetical protein
LESEVKVTTLEIEACLGAPPNPLRVGLPKSSLLKQAQKQPPLGGLGLLAGDLIPSGSYQSDSLNDITLIMACVFHAHSTTPAR